MSLGQDPGPEELSQQTGIIGASGQTFFGPATKDEYDESQWALATMDNTESAVEEIDHPENPHERKRNNEDPAVLSSVSSTERGFKPALINILHSIPAARNALIFVEHQLQDLGQLDTWYRGDPIDKGVVIEGVPSLEKEDLYIVFEIQRLMAFLDQSKRKYARPKHLANVLDSRPSNQGEYAKVLEQWLHVADKIKPDVKRRQLFTTRIIHHKKDREAEVEDDICFRLELTGPVQNLYEELNTVLWPSNDRHAFVREASDIICFDVCQKVSDLSTNGLGFTIPSEIYLDRYLEENLDAMIESHKDIYQREGTVEKLRERLNQATQFKPSFFEEEISAEYLLESGISILEAEPARRRRDAARYNQDDSNFGEADAKDESMKRQLKDILDWLRRKIERLTREIEEHESVIRQAKEHLIQQDLEVPQTHRYILRGVSVDGTKTYILRAPDSGAVTDLDMSSHAQECQWWCQDFSWSSTKDLSITVRPVTFYINHMMLTQVSRKCRSRRSSMTHPITESKCYWSMQMPNHAQKKICRYH